MIRASDVYEGLADPRQVSVLNVFLVFFLVAFVCQLLIPLLLNRLNDVLNGRDDIETWSRTYTSTSRPSQPSDWNSKRLS